jgi:hypothetical protein
VPGCRGNLSGFRGAGLLLWLGRSFGVGFVKGVSGAIRRMWRSGLDIGVVGAGRWVIVGVVGPWSLFGIACLVLGAAAVCRDLVGHCGRIAGVRSRLLGMLMGSHVVVRCYIFELRC